MVNSAWCRRLEGGFLRQVFTISQREPQDQSMVALDAQPSAGVRDLRIDSPGTFSSMR